MRQKLVQAPVPLGGWDGFLSVCMNYPSSPGTVPAWAAFAWLPNHADPYSSAPSSRRMRRRIASEDA